MNPQPHIPPQRRSHWRSRVQRAVMLAAALLLASLGLGVLGYHFLGNLGWVDSLLEASMILGGMGPVAPMQNDAVKLFASGYALYSGLVILSTSGLLISPWLQRMLYHTHRQASADARAECDEVLDSVVKFP